MEIKIQNKNEEILYHHTFRVCTIFSHPMDDEIIYIFHC